MVNFERQYIDLYINYVNILYIVLGLTYIVKSNIFD